MKKPLVTIVVVAGPDRKKELFHCLQTIYASTYKSIEVIVVDNSMNTEIARSVEKTFPSARRIIMPENTGIFGYNVGFANAQGAYILILDDDCALPKESIEHAVRSFEQKSEHVGVLTAHIYNPTLKNYSTQVYAENNLTTIPLFSGASMFRASALKKVGYFDASLFCWQHEIDLSLRMLDAGFTIYFEKQFVVIHPKGVEYRAILHYYISRNETWLAIKHFSFPFLELLLLKNLLVVLLLPFKYKTIKALGYGLLGYVAGYASLFRVLKQRKTVAWNIQKRFFAFHVLGRLES
ncbi:glycosyltransferase [Candidatus Woesebacteria bacterium]|nr:glycosyltransferase [Candidatus Woesebacteria bacterium]